MSKIKFHQATSVLLSIILIIGLLATTKVFAADTTINMDAKGSLTIYKLSEEKNGEEHTPLAGAEYTLYKIGTITQTGGNNVELVYTPLPGIGVDKLDSTTDPDSINTTKLTPKTSTATDSEGKTTFTNLEVAVYLVKETKTPTGVTAANNFIISIPNYEEPNQDKGIAGGWIYHVTAYPKNAANGTSIAKEITSSTAKDSGNNYTASQGETINYKVSVKLPNDFTRAGYSEFNIVDTPNTDLIIDPNTLEVKVGDETLAKDTDYTYSMTSGKLTIKLINENVYSNKLSDSAEVNITYSAKISISAAVGVAIRNDVEINYTYPGGSQVIKPSSSMKNLDIFVHSYTLKKVNKAQEPLAGAEFVIKNSAEMYMKYDDTNGWIAVKDVADATKVISGKDGLVKFSGLAGGSYTIVETKAPKDYTLLKDSIPVTLDLSTTTAEHSIVVVNEKGFNLPLTGDAGTFIFLIVGTILITVSLVMFIKYKKKKVD